MVHQEDTHPLSNLKMGQIILYRILGTLFRSSTISNCLQICVRSAGSSELRTRILAISISKNFEFQKKLTNLSGNFPTSDFPTSRSFQLLVPTTHIPLNSSCYVSGLSEILFENVRSFLKSVHVSSRYSVVVAQIRLLCRFLIKFGFSR